MKDLTRINEFDLLLEAEVAPRSQESFESRYEDITGGSVSPGDPIHYQDQPNKWGAELRVYFDDTEIADYLKSIGLTVEYREKGYKSGEYSYRVNDNDLWWELVEDHGLRLGPN